MKKSIYGKGGINIINIIIYLKKIRLYFIAYNLHKAFIFVLVFILIFSLLFYKFEAEKNENINSIKDSIWWGFVTSTTVGYGDIYPVTTAGRILAVLNIIVGIGVFGFITASVASIFVERNFKKGMGLLDVNFKDHIIIVGWGSRSKSLIEEFMNQDNRLKIALISDNIDHNPFNNKNILYIKGEPWAKKVLDRANVKNAKTAIVLADYSIEKKEIIDSKSLMICLAIDKINPDIHLIAEVTNHTNIPHFESVNVDDIIITNQLQNKILVRSILYDGVNKAFKELINDNYGNKMFQSSLDSKLVGKTYEEIVNKYLNLKLTVIGFYRGNCVHLNPPKDTILKNYDQLICIGCKPKTKK